MLGCEYNWLASPSRKTPGASGFNRTSGVLLTLAVAVFCFLCLMLGS
jgi:hypothetical protein